MWDHFILTTSTSALLQPILLQLVYSALRLISPHKKQVKPPIRKHQLFIHFFSTLYTVPTGAPLNISAADVGPRYVLLRWQPPQFDLQNGRIRQYLIQVIHNRTGLTYTVVSSTNQYRLENLFPFHTYIFSIAAETVGLGPYSTQITVTTSEAGTHLTDTLYICFMSCVCT